MPINMGALRGALLNESYSITTTGGTTTLTAEEARSRGIVINGVLASAATIVLPLPTEFAQVDSWEVLNATTGDFTVTFSGPSGTTVAIPRNARGRIRWTGSAMIFSNPLIQAFSGSLSPAEVAANTSAEQTFTISGRHGMATSDTLIVNKPTAQAGLGIVGCRVVNSTDVGITFANFTGTPITPTAAQTYRFTLIRGA